MGNRREITGYSVVNSKTGEYYAPGCVTRQECVQQMEANEWRNATIVTRYRPIAPPKRVKFTGPRVYLYELQRLDGAKTYHRELTDIMNFLGVTKGDAESALTRKGFARCGVFKEFLINMVMVGESEVEALLKEKFPRPKAYKEVYVVKHRKGSECMFDTLKEARKFLKLSWWKVKVLLEEDDYATSGSATDWRVFTRLVEV